MPTVDDVEGYLMGQDVIWVNGGSVINLLAVWRAHGLDDIFPRVLAGGGRAGWSERGITVLVQKAARPTRSGPSSTR